MPAAIAADSPPLDPPGVRSRSRRTSGKQIVALNPIGEFRQVGLGKQDATGLLQACDAGRVAISMRPLKIGEPRCVMTPPVSIESFAVKGTPCRGPSSLPARAAASALRAA